MMPIQNTTIKPGNTSQNYLYTKLTKYYDQHAGLGYLYTQPLHLLIEKLAFACSFAY